MAAGTLRNVTLGVLVLHVLSPCARAQSLEDLATPRDAGAARDPAAPSQQMGLAGAGAVLHPLAEDDYAPEHVAELEESVRNQLESLRRFDDFLLPPAGGDETPEEFVERLQQHLNAGVAQLALKRLQAEGDNFDFLFNDTIITADDMRQVFDSAYAYEIEIFEPEVEQVGDPHGRILYKAKVRIRVRFYRILTWKPGLTPTSPDVPVPPAEGVESFDDSFVDVTVESRHLFSTPEGALEDAVNQPMSGLATDAKLLPEFKLQSQVIDVLAGGKVTIRHGRDEDVVSGGGWRIYAPNEDGTKEILGEARAQQVRPGIIPNGDGVSLADSLRTILKLQPASSSFPHGVMAEEIAPVNP